MENLTNEQLIKFLKNQIWALETAFEYSKLTYQPDEKIKIWYGGRIQSYKEILQKVEKKYD